MNNKNFYIITVIIAIITFSLFTIAGADTLNMKNGDKISGDVTLKNGMVNVKPEYCEKILIPFNKISNIEFNKNKDTEPIESINDDILKNALNEKIEPDKYPNAGVITIYRERIITFNEDRTSKSESRVVFKVLKERGLNEGNIVRTYRKADENIEVIFARSVSPDGKIVSNIRQDAIKRTDKYIYYPIYDKLKILQFSVPEVKIGSVVDYKTVASNSKCDILNPAEYNEYFISNDPSIISKLKIIYPKNVKIDFKKYNFEKDSLEIKIEKTADNTIVTYEKRNIPDFIQEPAMPPLPYFAPMIRFIEKYDLKAIAAELKKRISPATALDENLKAEVAKIIEGKKTPKEKAVAIYEYLATTIKDVSVHNSINDYNATPIAVLYNEKYASSFDRAVMLYTFLKEAGLKADICFGTYSNFEPFDADFFTITDFHNVLVECEGDFLNPDAEYYPYGIIPSEYTDNKYFRIFEGSGKLFDIKREKFEKKYSDLSLDIKISKDGNTLFTLTETGYGEDDPVIRASFKNMKPVHRKQTFEQIASDIAKGGKMNEYKLSDVENKSIRAYYTVNFESNNYISKLGDSYMLVPIPYTGVNTGLVAKEKRNFDIFFDEYSLDSMEIKMKLPEGYKLKYLPKSFENKSEYFDFSMKLSYDEKNNQVIYKRTNHNLNKIISKDDYKKLKEQYEKAGLLKKERMILEKITK